MKVIKHSVIVSALFVAFNASSMALDTSKLSASGFIDLSWQYKDIDGGVSNSDFGVDQVELDLIYKFDNQLSIRTDIEYQNASAGVDIEQAYLNYDFLNGFYVKAGRFLSNSGFEAEEPTGLYQYSGTGYAAHFYGYYQQGVSVGYQGELFATAISTVSDLAGPQSTDFKQPGVELMLAITPSEEVTVKGFYSFDKLEGTNEDISLFNLWASYHQGPLTFGAEYNKSENAPSYAHSKAGIGSEAEGYLAMVNHAFDSFSLTFRYHDWQIESANKVTIEDAKGFTIAPNFNLNDNVLLVFEFRMEEVNDKDAKSIAAEALVTF